jgi:DNA repair protein RecO (recombination protein O)
MFVHYRTRGIILKKVDRAENDQLFTIYTKDFGKIKILGRGIRKISSKLKSGAELFYLTEVEFIQGKIHKTLTDAILIDKFKNLRRNLARLNIASKITELLDKLIYDLQLEAKIWKLLLEVFQELNQPNFKTTHLKLIYYYFFWRLISILGYSPELFQCVMCAKKLKPQKLYFNFQEGGINCQNCFEKEKKGYKVIPEIVKVIRILIVKEWSAVSRIKIEEKHLKSLEVISRDYLSFVLEGVS